MQMHSFIQLEGRLKRNRFCATDRLTISFRQNKTPIDFILYYTKVSNVTTKGRVSMVSEKYRSPSRDILPATRNNIRTDNTY